MSHLNSIGKAHLLADTRTNIQTKKHDLSTLLFSFLFLFLFLPLPTQTPSPSLITHPLYLLPTNSQTPPPPSTQLTRPVPPTTPSFLTTAANQVVWEWSGRLRGWWWRVYRGATGKIPTLGCRWGAMGFLCCFYGIDDYNKLLAKALMLP